MQIRAFRTSEAPTAEVPVLVVLTGPQLGERVWLTERVDIGRDPRASLRLRDPAVEAMHASVTPEEDGWRLQNLGAGLTQVVGHTLAPRASRLVTPQQEIRVGDTLLRIELHGEVELEFDRIVVERLHRDDLTGLYSRRKFEDELAAAIDLDDQPLALVMLDIDGLKRVNDAHGHLAGAAVIAHVGRTLAEALGGRGVAARLGGDELAVLLPMPRDEAAEIAEALLDAVRHAPCVHEGRTHRVTVSAGLCDRREDLSLIMRAADDALLEAKRLGGDRLVLAR